MKNILTIIIWCCPLFLIAQQSSISGEVSIMNSKFNTGQVVYVPFAQVNEDFGKSQATTTDKDGQFNLILINIKEKESISFSVVKKGLEVINIDQLNAIADQEKKVKIFMADPKTIADNRKKYYEVGITTAERKLSKKIKGLKKEINILKDGDSENIQKIAALQNQISNLQDKFSQIDRNAKLLANKYSRINFDEADEMLQQAFVYFQEGEFEKALQSLTENDIDGKSNTGLNRRDKIQKARKILDSLEQKNEASIQRLIPALLFKADLHELFLQPDSVRYCFNLLLQMDSSKVDILSAYASFNNRQNNYELAQQLYTKCIGLSDTLEKAHFLHLVGIQISRQRKFIEAEKKFLRAIQLLEPNITPAKKKLLVEIHLTFADRLEVRDLKYDAYDHLKIAQKYSEELFRYDANKYQGRLADTYNEIGRFFIYHNWSERDEETSLIKADRYYYTEKAIQSYEFLKTDNPTKYEEIILSLKSAILIHKTRSYGADSPGAAWEKILLAQLEIYNTDQLEYDQFGVLTNLANYYYLERNTKEGEKTFKKALNIAKKLAQKNPERYDPLYAKALRNLGNFYMKIGDPHRNYHELSKQAILIADQYAHIPEMENLSESLLKIIDIQEVYPEYKKWESKTNDFKNLLFYATRPLPQERDLEDYKSIAEIQTKILDVWLAAYRQNPDNPHYKYEIARYAADLAESQLLLQNFKQAEILSRKSMVFDNRDSHASAYLAVALFYLDRFEESTNLINDYKTQPNTFNTANYDGLNMSWKLVLIGTLSSMVRMNIKHKNLAMLEPYFDKTIWIHINAGW